MLEPKKIKRRKQHRYRGAFGRKATRGTQLAFGTIGLKAQEAGELTARQIEAARRALTHSVHRGGKIWIRVFPHIPVSRKAAEVPMGSGKGSLDHYATILRAGTIIFEMGGLPEQTARTALQLAAYKLPVRTKIVTTSLL
ncbi:MAG: 50S ribosomal protein L16 [Candidatus Peregrinibacteria bacterium]